MNVNPKREKKRQEDTNYQYQDETGTALPATDSEKIRKYVNTANHHFDLTTQTKWATPSKNTNYQTSLNIKQV